jgi:hypothetical protein
MKRSLLLLVVLAAGCTKGSDGPGDTVPGPPRDLVEKGSKPPVGNVPPGANAK